MRDLAAKIVLAAAPSRSIALFMKNISSLSPEEAAFIEQRLRADLSEQGGKISEADPSGTPVEVTLSQNFDGFLWVATVGAESEMKVLILKPLPRSTAVENQSGAIPILRRSVLLRQREPILDFELTSSPDTQMLLVLESAQIAFLRNSDNGWRVEASAAIHHSQPWPRDLRGHVVISSSAGFEAFLPGVHCTGTFSPSLAANCQDTDATWPAGSFKFSFVGTRNYLSVSGLAANDLLAAYSAAPFANAILMAGTDGVQRSWTNGTLSILPSAHWGDDIAPIASACGTDEEIVATASGDWTQRDLLQPYQVSGANASPVGDAIEFPGPIVALWPPENGNSVRVISRSLETGLYEASIVSISCGN